MTFSTGEHMFKSVLMKLTLYLHETTISQTTGKCLTTSLS